MLPVRLLAILAASMSSACSSPPVSFDSPDPSARLNAITKALRERDRGSIPDLIDSLEHDDPLVRLAAIRGLEEFTGETRGYSYADPDFRRQEAIERWIDWYRAQSPEAPPAASRSAR